MHWVLIMVLKLVYAELDYKPEETKCKNNSKKTCNGQCEADDGDDAKCHVMSSRNTTTSRVVLQYINSKITSCFEEC